MKKYRIISLLLLNLMLLMSFGCVKVFRYSIGCAEIKSDEDFTFFIVSDIHHLTKEGYDNGKAFREYLDTGDGKLIQYSGELLDALTRDIKAEQPDFVVFTGDLTCNGERKSHLDLVKRLKAIEDEGTCVFVVPGNHDVQNPWAIDYIGDEPQKGSMISNDEYLNIYSPFGYEGAVSRDTDSLSYLAMPTEDTWLLMLDSTITNRNVAKQSPEQGGELKPQTLKWIEQCGNLAKDNNVRLIAVMHHSLIDHSHILNENYTLENSEEAVKVFGRCGIEIVLTGHVHIQDIKSCQYEDKTIYDIATSSLVVYPHQYGRMDYTYGRGFDYRTVMVDVGKWSRQEQVDDEVLLNFETRSMELFVEQCGRMHQRCLSRQDDLSEEDRKVYLDIIDRMNILYFAGYRNEALSGIVNTEAFERLKEIKPCFTKEYAMSMLEDQRTDNNVLHIPVHEDNEGSMQ